MDRPASARLLLAAAAAAALLPSPSAERSILYMMADDLGWQDLGFRETAPGVPTDLLGATPFLDSLAAEGVLLDHLCA
jgi:arylsulfatase A-like enzyme